MLAVLFVVFCCVSCKKDGVYKPKEKISKIYYEYSYITYSDGDIVYKSSPEKNLSEKWHWEKEKLIQIEHDFWPYNFIYKKNQLEKIECAEMVVKFIYNESLYEKIEISNKGKDLLIITINERNKNNITKFSIQMFYDDDTWYDYAKNKSNVEETQTISVIEPIIQLLFPSSFTHFITKNIAEKTHKSITVETYTVELKYDKNNVIEQTFKDSYGDELTYIFSYDKKKNPFYKSSHTFLEGIEEGFFIQSENNILTMYEKNYPEDITKYEYEYNGDYPTKQIEKYTYGNERFLTERSSIYYYEYE